MGRDKQVPSVEWRADPKRTHVVAVGISTYAIGPLWTLPLAAEHAVEFAEWALFGGVEPNNIHLFISSSDKAKLTDRVMRAGLFARVATRQEISEFIDKELKDISGDLLYLFWSGHGSISENRERILFFEDLSNDFIRALDLNHLLVRLRSEPHGKFRRQLAYVDACANRFEDLRFKTSAGLERPGIGRLIAGVRQVFFLAADSGQEATAGEFSKAILQSLRQQYETAGIWPPDPDAVREAVRPIFDETYQRPVQIAWSTKQADEYGEEVSGDLPSSDYVNDVAREAGLPVRFLRSLAARAAPFTTDGSGAKRDALYQRLAKRSAPAGRAARLSPQLDLLQLIATAFEAGQIDELLEEVDDLGFTAELRRLNLLREARALLLTLATTIAELRKDYLVTVMPLDPAPQRVAAVTLDAMLDELTNIHASDDPLRFLWQFLMRVAAHQAAPASKIETFVGKHASRVLVNTIREELQREQRFLLSIAFEPTFDVQPLPKAVEAKLLFAETANIVQPFPPRIVDTWAGAELAVAEIVRDARNIVIDKYRKEEGALDIEFLLPEGCFSQAPDQFGLGLRLNRATLGRVHSVVVRWRARILEPSTTELGPWYAAGKRIDRKAYGKVEWLDATKDANQACSSCGGLLALGFLPQNEMEDLIGAGFPFIVWLRSQPADGWPAFKERFDAWVRSRRFDQLPRELRAIRQSATDLGTCLTMFWDDPDYSKHWMPVQEPRHD